MGIGGGGRVRFAIGGVFLSDWSEGSGRAGHSPSKEAIAR